jgi:rod shape-determining protein MreC
MQKKLSIILIALFFGSVLVFFNSQGFLAGAGDAIGRTISPVTTYFSKTGSGTAGFFSGIFNIGKLQEENARLSDRLNELEAENARLNEIKNENESLRKDLAFTEKSDLNYVPAEVIAYDPSNIRGLVTINQGSKDGLKVGMAAVSEGFFIGKIIEIGDNFAKIMLVTDPSSAVPVEIQGSSTSGIVKGKLGTGLVMEKIPQGDKIETGNTVITSGLGGEIPRGIIVGQVKQVERIENSLFIDANIQPQARLSNILRVLVITK